MVARRRWRSRGASVPTPGPSVATVAVLAGVVAAALTACGPGSEDLPTSADRPPGAPERTGSERSSPFTVGPVPAGYEPVTAGTGRGRGDWGEDSTGTHEPYTVASRDGTGTGPEVVVVSITGFEGYQGGLDQAAAGSMIPDGIDDTAVDGAEARYSPAHADDHRSNWADLVVARGDDLAVRVTSPEATREELVAVLDGVEVPADRSQAPTLAEPPPGLTVVGSVDVEAVLAFDPFVRRNSDWVPGGASTHAAGWLAADPDRSDQLVVATLPGRSVDLAAVVAAQRWRGWRQTEVRELQVGDRPGLVVDEVEPDDPTPGVAPWRSRSIWAETDWGDVVVVSASGEHVPSEDELVALAGSVEVADDEAWTAFVVEATGGPGLNPDDGRTELARGRVGELEWLLQDGPPGGGMVLGTGIDPDSLHGVDRCLKLSNRRRACALSGGGGIDDWVTTTGGSDPDGLRFLLVSTTLEASSVRVTTPTDAETAPLVAVPGGGLWAAVVFVDVADTSTAVCEEGLDTDMEMPEHLVPVRVEALDGGGEVLACLGAGGHRPDDGG